jgi:tRNA(fMet)-specific endonuclease VapC
MKYLIDTDWLIDAIGAVSTALSTLQDLRMDGLAISIVSVGEIYEGAFHAPDFVFPLQSYREFIAPFVVLPLSDPIMERFARVRADLRRQGNPIPDFDLAIGATALEHGFTLLTRNTKHFVRIPQLQLYQSP